MPLFDANAPLPVAPLGPAERLACLRLIRSENVGPVAFRELINQFGGAAAALNALPALAARGGRRSRIRTCSVTQAEAELDAAAHINATPLFTIEPNYPFKLAHTDPPPPMIYVQGNLELLNRPGIAIVGSRNCSTAGHAFARQLSSALSELEFVVISGLARGIDGAAHAASIAGGTIAVVAGGLDVFYPPEHADLQRRIAEQGCVVSEMPPGFKPRAKDFPRRNRIISGMSYGVVIVEAAKRSGTLITARLAAEQGRDVFAVPGHPLDPRAEGTNGLIRDGATMITRAADILEVIAAQLPEAERRRAEAIRPSHHRPKTPPASSSGEPGLSTKERAHIESVLGPTPIHVDDLLRSTGLGAQQVKIALLELSLAGRLEHHGANLVSVRTASA